MSKGGLWQGARMEEGGWHQALHDSGSRPAGASVAWSRRAGRKGQKAPREPCSFLLLPFPRILAPLSPLAVPQLDHSAPWGCSGVGPPLWHSPQGRGQGPAGLAEGWGGMPAPAQEGQRRQLGAVLGPSIIFLKGLLRDERPEGAIPEAGADAEACGQGRETGQPVVLLSPGCCWGQVTACSTLTGEGGAPAFQGGRKAR